MVRRQICSFLQLVVLLQLGSIVNASESDELVKCSFKTMTRVRLPNKQTLYSWPEDCQVFQGALYLRMIDLTCADFTNLIRIDGQLSVVNTNFHRLPRMPNLVKIRARGPPGVLILNNENLRDLRGLVHYQKLVHVEGSIMPVFISGNPNLDTVNYPKLFHKPYSPLSCEKRLTPNYNITFAEGQSLTMVLVSLVLVITIFLYPLGMGSANVYFVPGYHKC